MSYVIAGYSIVLAILFLYAVLLVVRRHRLAVAAARVADSRVGATAVGSGDGSLAPAPGAHGDATGGGGR